MRIIHLLAAGAATLAVAVPAAAQQPYAYPYAQQTYPQYQYPQGQYPQGYAQPGYGYPGQPGGQNVLGQVINQLLGNRYNVTDRTAVTQCATAAMTQASAQYRPRGYRQGYPQGYGQGYGQPGYNQGYNPAMRVTAITDVRRQSRSLRVSGLMSSGMQSGYGRYGQPGYGNQVYGDPRYAQTGDLTFRCNVAYNGRVTDVRIGRNTQQ
jgi:hypothetical protein